MTLWYAKLSNLLEGQRYLFYLSSAFCIFFVFVALLFWHKASLSSYKNFEKHLSHQKDVIDFKLNILMDEMQKLGFIFSQPDNLTVGPDPQEFWIWLSSCYGLLNTRLALDDTEQQIFGQLRTYGPASFRRLLTRCSDIQGVYFISKKISFVAPIAKGHSPQEIDRLMQGLVPYNFSIFARLSSYFTGWTPPHYRQGQWHMRYVHPCYKHHKLIGFFGTRIGKKFFVNQLNTLNIPFGSLLLVTKNGDILLEKNVHGLVKNSKIPKQILSYMRYLGAQKVQHKTRIKNYRVHTFPLQAGPWNLCFFVSDVTFFNQTLWIIGFKGLWVSLLYIGIGLFVLLIFNFYLVRAGFLLPVRMLMNHINKERLNIEATFSLSWGRWQRWAQLISVSFEEKRTRTALVENTLKERMGDLVQMMDYLKKNQSQMISQEKLVTLGGTSIGIAYEIRGFLSRIYTLITCKDSAITPLEKTTLKEIERCNTLLRDVLICTQTHQDVLTPLSIRFLLKRYIKLASVSFFSKNTHVPVIIDMKLSTQDDVMCLGFSHQLGATFFSLVFQALESALYGYSLSQDTLPKVSIQLERQDYNVAIHIKDTGPFIDEEQRKKLWEEQQSNNTLQSASCLSVIQNHDGNIFFEEGEDNHICVILPIERTASKERLS